MTENEAIVFEGVGDVTVDSRPMPEPDPNQALIRTRRTMVSTGTELTALSGKYPSNSEWDEYSDYPFVPGYNNIGEVVEVGDELDSSLVGQRVATWRPHATYVTAKRSSIRVVPDGISDAEAAFFSIAEIVMNGVRQSELDWGGPVAVFGLGLLGQLAVQTARFAGARPVVAFEFASSRRSFVPDLPGVEVVDPSQDNEELVREATGGRLADVVFEVTGNPEAIHDEVDVLRELGTLVLLSSPRGPTEFDFHDNCNAPSYEIKGTHVMSHPTTETPHTPWTRRRHAELFFDLVAADELEVDSLVTHEQSYRNAPDVYDELLEDRTDALGVQFEW